MAQTSGGNGPIPPAKKDDSEDVAWALSTAEAMCARGDRSDALKWLRRAAEAASEAQADDRALELAKAAADLASTLAPTSTPPPPSRPAPPLTAKSPIPARAPSVPARLLGTPPRPPAGAISPFVSTSTPNAESRRTGRPARPDIIIARPAEEGTQPMATVKIPGAPANEPPSEGAHEVTPPGAPVQTWRDPSPIPPDRATRPEDLTAAAQTEAIDSWPTASMLGDDLPDPPDETTRIGVPAYEASAKLASEASVVLHAPIAPPPHLSHEPALRASQAIRVVVWRAVDGVHVAPQGTRVSAISVDAILVALDPTADLAAWLSGK
jgi:hypothetical protein